MDLSTFLDHLDSHGGDVAAWSNDARTGAEALMVHSAPARAALIATLEVERLMRAGAARGGALGPGADVLAARAMRRPQDHATPLSSGPATRAMFAAAAVVALCLGVALGWGQGQHDDGPDRVLAIAFDPAGTVDVD